MRITPAPPAGFPVSLAHRLRREGPGGATMDDTTREEKDRRPKAPDQLSPARALDESLGASESQRIGNNEPVAYPLVSFPGEVEGEETAA